MNSPYARIRQLVMLMLVLSASMTFGSIVHAQEENGLAEGPVEEKQSPQQKMLEQAMKRQMDHLKKSYEAKMAVRIQEMAEVCKLNEPQVRQLKLAAKGSIVKAIDDQKQQMEEMQSQFMADGMDVNFVAGQPLAVNVDVAAELEVATGVNVEIINPAAPAAPVEPAEPVEPAKPADKEETGEAPKDPAESVRAEDAVAAEGPMVARAMAVDFAMGMPFMGNEDGEKTPWKQPVWLETVAGTLTDEQATTLESFEKARTARTQKTRIQSFVQTIDTELHLNAKQRADLEAWMEKDYASYFTDPNVEYMFSGSGMMGGGFFVEVDDGQPQAQADPEHFAVVSKILSPEQMELWKTGYGETFRALENMNRGGQGDPALNGLQQILAPFR